MEHALASGIAERLLALVEAKTTTLAPEPAAFHVDRYLDSERFQRERQRLFLERPQLVAFSSDVASPGSYSTLEVMGVPVLLVRGSDGELRAFRNACLHRGARVAEGSGDAARFVCPWHCWTYDEHGALVGLPDRGSFQPLDLERRSLTPLPVDECGGVVLLRPTPGPAFAAAEVLCGLGEQFEACGFPRLRHFETADCEVRANWKLVTDTGVEVYHVSYLHKDSVGPSNIGNTHVFDTFGPHQRMGIAAPSIIELRDSRPEDWSDAFRHIQLVHNVFPATGIVVAEPFVALARAEPGDAPNRTRFVFSVYTWGPARSEEVRGLAKLGFEGLLHVLRSEDWRVAEQAQRSFEIAPGSTTVVGRNEIGVQHLHRACDEALQGQPASGSNTATE